MLGDNSIQLGHVRYEDLTNTRSPHSEKSLQTNSTWYAYLRLWIDRVAQNGFNLNLSRKITTVQDQVWQALNRYTFIPCILDQSSDLAFYRMIFFSRSEDTRA